MSVWYYEPFYHWDRLFEDPIPRSQRRLPAQEGQANDVQRFLKPRFVHTTPDCSHAILTGL